MSSFLPENYEAPKSESGYMKLKQGENRFRVLSSAIVGWEYWNKPIRSKEPFEGTPADARLNQGKFSPKHFWAFVVWSYQDKKIQILQLTQAGIQRDIEGFVQDADYGDPKTYDTLIKREGETLNDTKYNVIPKPPKPTDPEILNAYKEMTINLPQLYVGGNPFGEGETDEISKDDNPFSNEPFN